MTTTSTTSTRCRCSSHHTDGPLASRWCRSYFRRAGRISQALYADYMSAPDVASSDELIGYLQAIALELAGGTSYRMCDRNLQRIETWMMPALTNQLRRWIVVGSDYWQLELKEPVPVAVLAGLLERGRHSVREMHL